MLVLTRKAGEKIIIGKDIVITILKSKGNQTRIGISAPPKVSVHREEIYRLIQMQTHPEKEESEQHEEGN